MLPQSDVCNLSLATKSLYRIIRPIFYRHPKIVTYDSLILFSRTFSEATSVGKAEDSRDQTKFLEITIDPRRIQPPPAVMISRTIHAIVRHCPNLAITLRFSHCRCHLSPVSALGTETFPRVTKLIVHVGERDPDHGYSDVSPKKCGPPSAAFWRPFVNGEAFPDCKDLEIRHYWATTPPPDASLDLQEAHHAYGFPTPSPPRSQAARLGSRFGRARPSFGQGGPSASSYLPDTELIGSTSGLKNFRTIVLECPTELNSLLFMQLLGNPNAIASDLTSLELRFCNLDDLTISKLLHHAPSKVKRLVLLCCDPQGDTVHDPTYLSYENPETRVHLCPLIREFGKDLVYLDYGAPTVCRELFFDDNEMQALKGNGIETRLGIEGGATDRNFVQLDGHAVRETIQSCRKQQHMKHRIERIKIAVGDASTRLGYNSMNNTDQVANKAQRETEALLDEEEEKRNRLIQGSKAPWFRRIITYHGLCNPADTWAEMQIAADMEEKGIEWVLASRFLESISHFVLSS